MIDREAVQHGFLPPTIDADSETWWAAIAEGRLLLPHCTACDLKWFPPTPGCPRCGSAGVTLIQASGKGTVYSWVVVNRALHDAFAGDAPYVILAVDLEEGARIFGRLVGPATEGRLLAGAGLRAVFYQVEGRALVGFAFE